MGILFHFPSPEYALHRLSSGIQIFHGEAPLLHHSPNLFCMQSNRFVRTCCVLSFFLEAEREVLSSTRCSIVEVLVSLSALTIF
jgi:hypothetical protein